MASRRAKQPGHRSSGELLREVVSAVVPEGECEQYLPFARELWLTLRRQQPKRQAQAQAPDFSRKTKLVVQKWFVRGLSGHLLWRIGVRLLGRLYPAASAHQGLN